MSQISWSKILILLTFLSTFYVYSQSGITSTAIDSTGKTLSIQVYDSLSVTYKTKGKKYLYAKLNNETIDKFIILDVVRTEDYISLIVFCETKNDILVRQTYFIKENKREICFNERYKFVETGDGLSYKISKRVRGKKGSLALFNKEDLPPNYW